MPERPEILRRGSKVAPVLKPAVKTAGVHAEFVEISDDGDGASSYSYSSSSSLSSATFSPSESVAPVVVPTVSAPLPNHDLEYSYAFEVGCGRAVLTRALQRAGWGATGIDWQGNRDRPVAKCIWLDLTTAIGQQLFWKLVRSHPTIFVHFAPPCGTASRAREIRIKNAAFDPKPLRSDDYPDGLPSLHGVDEVRVRAANKFYEFTADAAIRLQELGIEWSIENPSNSLMWKTSPFQRLFKLRADGQLRGGRVSFDMCMHGGERNKSTDLLFSGGLNLMQLQKSCDGNHKHKPWGLVKDAGTTFATAAERVYPELLCSRLVTAVTNSLPNCKLAARAPVLQTHDRVHLNAQPRRHMLEIVPEFEAVKSFSCTPSEAEAVAGALKKPSGLSLQGVKIGTGCKVLREQLGEDGRRTLSIGFPWSEASFVHAARKVVHPFDRRALVPPAVAQAIHAAATLGPHGLARSRKDCLAHYANVARSLSDKETALHDSLHPDVKGVVSEKRILLFKQMLEDIQYDDPGVADLLVTGIKIIGELPKTGIWRPDPSREQKCPAEMMWAGAKDAQRKALSARPGWTEEDAALWQCTLEEVTEGGLRGPLSVEEVSAVAGKLWVPARRFAVVQNGKLRPIDDFSEFMVNACFGACEKVSLLGMDQIISWTRARLDAWSDDGRLDLVDTELRSPVVRSFPPRMDKGGMA